MKRRWAAIVSIGLATGLFGCGNDSGASMPQPSATPSLVQSRPYATFAPTSYRAGTPTPLVLLLHGYGANGRGQAEYFGLLPDAEEHGYLLAYPDGTVDSRGNRFWNATDACCNIYGSSVDDVAYLRAVIDDVAARYTVDPRRVFVIGHSNGGFMAHRLACDIGGRIAAVISLAGAVWRNPSRCASSAPVNVLQVHGDVDQTVPYAGTFAFLSAPETVATWAARNGCSGGLGPRDLSRDLDTGVTGAETREEGYAGCPPGGAADLWTIEAGGHVPAFGPSWADETWAYFRDHPKP